MIMAERDLYEAVENYISSTYNAAAAGERNAVGFVMTVYRRRLASSFAVLARTLRQRLETVDQGQLFSYRVNHIVSQQDYAEARRTAMRYVVIFAILVLCPTIGLAQSPTIDIKCNGLDSGVWIDPGANAKIDFSITAGSGLGNDVDIWVILKTSSYYYSYNSFGPIQGWNKGIHNAYYTGPLVDMNDTALESPVPYGDYFAYVVIDTCADGFFDRNLIYTFDSVDFATEIEGMALIPAGEFDMGDHYGVGDRDELPVHTVFIKKFWMDSYEVTNLRYCKYLNSAYDQGLIQVIGGVVYKANDIEPYCNTAPTCSSTPIKWDDNKFEFTVLGNRGAHPMVWVTWYGAAAYANWRSAQCGLPACYDLNTWVCTFDAGGYRLPTEAEWEKAARGGEQDPYYQYPWGNIIDGSQANYDQSGDPFPDTTPVGFYNGKRHYKVEFGWPGKKTSFQTSDGKNGWGLYDTAGNVWEWCNDWFDSTYYSSSPYNNPYGPVSGASRVRRGGCWDHIARYGRSAKRGALDPGSSRAYLGFRLAFSP